jgi:hypothetical protein
MEDFDELDRALFALPLAVPPADLRASILRATIYAEPTSPFAFAETAGIGAVLAFAVWLAAYVLSNPAFSSAFALQIGTALRLLPEGQTLAWLAAGVAVVLVANTVTDGFALQRVFRKRP